MDRPHSLKLDHDDYICMLSSLYIRRHTIKEEIERCSSGIDPTVVEEYKTDLANVEKVIKSILDS